MSRKPSTSAIDTAIKNGERDFSNYDVVSSVTAGVFFAEHKNDGNRVYRVDTRTGKKSCDCPQHEREGVCKHAYIVERTVEIEEEAAGRQEWEDMRIEVGR